MPAWSRRCARWPRNIRVTDTARIRILLEREGHVMSTDRMYRLWRQEGMQVPKTRPRRRVDDETASTDAADRASITSGPTTRVRQLRERLARSKCLTIMDEWTRECLAIDVAGGIRSGAYRGTDAARARAWRAPLTALGQRARVRRARRFCAGCRPRHIETALHRRRQAMAELRPTKRSTALRDQQLSLQWFRQARRRQGRASSNGDATTTRCGRTQVSGI